MDRMLRYWRWGWALLVALFVMVGPSVGWAGAASWSYDDIIGIRTMSNVGVGTMTPSAKLAINGGLHVGGDSNPGDNNLQVDGTSRLSGDLVGIAGTNMNLSKDVGRYGAGALRMTSSSASGPAVFTMIPSGTPVAGDLVAWRMYNKSDAANTGSATFSIVVSNPASVALNSITWGTGTPVSSFVIPNMNLGIGTATPTAKLHVIGDAIISGNIAAKYQDVAEWVPTKSALLPGTVVIIDSQATNQVLPAAKPYDTRVAGVVSTQPGILLGEAGDDKAKIAHSGRVPVKVDASFGPIAAGDLLVTSPTPGYAMRSTPVDLGGVPIHRPGTLVGKALEPLAEGQGEILVLLTLQ